MRCLSYLILVVFLTGCKTFSYFGTANDVSQIEGTLYLLNGEEKNGLLTVQFEMGIQVDRFIHVKNGDQEEKYLIDSVKCYKIKSNIYFPKKIIPESDGIERILFVKQLSKENSKIVLYEFYKNQAHTDDGKDFYMYFISVPGLARLETWNLGSKNLVPNFDIKMSTIVADCPSLSNKIKTKVKGYFLPQFTLTTQSRIKVLTKIIDEYNNCQ